MHFIEQFFGLAPDGRSGRLEIVLLTVTLVVCLLAIRWRRDRWSHSSRQKETGLSTSEKFR